MKLIELEEHLFAYFVCGNASGVNIDGRFRRRDEFVEVFENVFFYSTQRFGAPVAGRHPQICDALIEKLIEAGALLASHDKWSGTSYQFNALEYAKFIRSQCATNAICQRATQVGPQFWDQTFSGIGERA